MDRRICEKPYAAFAALAPSQTSPAIPYQQPSGAARGAEVTAGAARFGVQMVIAVAGILAPILRAHNRTYGYSLQFDLSKINTFIFSYSLGRYGCFLGVHFNLDTTWP